MTVVSEAMRPYRPYGAALDLLYYRGTEVLLAGPAGTGKSRACLEKVHACLELYPGARALLVRKTRASLTESGLVTYEDKVLPEGHAARTPMQRAQRQHYRYPNGSELVVGGMDRASRIMSTEFDLVCVQEATELLEADVEALNTRLRNGAMPYQQMIADCNPGPPQHWLKQRCDRGTCRMMESRHEDNPTLWDSEAGVWTERGERYIARLEQLTGARLQRLRYGRWVGAEGLVYEAWDRAAHVVNRFEIPPDWRRVRSVDFGYTNPFVCQWWAVDPDGRAYLYRELYRTGRIVRDHAAQIRRLTGIERIEATVADHDAEDRATLAAEGVRTIPAQKTVSPGVQAVQNRLRDAGDGKPRLFLLRDSLVERDEELAEAMRPWCTEQEFDGYVWAPPTEGRAAKEEPVKLHDHGMDALRYLVCYLDGIGGHGPLRAGQIQVGR